MSIDQYPGSGATDAPSEDFYAITPSDTADLSTRPRAIYVGVTGDIAMRARDNATVIVFKNVPSGTLLPCRSNRVMSTATTATSLVAIL